MPRKKKYQYGGSAIPSYINNSTKRRLYDNLTPIGYGNTLERGIGALFGKKGVNRDDVPNIREDAWALYLGLPQEHGSFKESQYKPTNASDPNAVYYDSDKFGIYNLPRYNTYTNQFDGQTFSASNPYEEADNRDASVMGHYTTSIGQDDRGGYMSYYDKWDLQTDHLGIGKPFEIYGRIYEDELKPIYNSEVKRYNDVVTKDIVEDFDKYATKVSDGLSYIKHRGLVFKKYEDDGRIEVSSDELHGYPIGTVNPDGSLNPNPLKLKFRTGGNINNFNMSRHTKRQPLRHYPEPPEMFLGGIGKFFGKVGKGIGKGIGAVAKGVKDATLFGVDNFTNLALGADLIKDGAYSYGVSKDISGFTGNALNKIGDVAVPVASSIFLGPGAAAAVSGLRGTTNALNDGKNFWGALGAGALGAGGSYLGAKALGNTGGFGNFKGNLGNFKGMFSGMSGAGGLDASKLGDMPTNVFGQAGVSANINPATKLNFGQLMGNLGRGLANNPLSQLGGGFNPLAGIGGGFNPMGGLGAYGTPGFMGGMMGGQMPFMMGGMGLASLLGGMRNFRFEQGGEVRKFQSGGLVDIQAEKGEYIFHPTGMLTDVHAKTSHSKMEKNGDDDVVTDHPYEGSFIFSDYLKLNKSDAEDMIVGVRRFPYDENKKGKEPEVFTVGDLFGKKERKLSPAKLAKRIKDTYKVTGNKDDLFDIIGDEMNIENRVPYLEAVSMLSEVERYKDDMIEEPSEMEELLKAKKGGKMRSRWVRKAQTGFHHMDNPPISIDPIGQLPITPLPVPGGFGNPGAIGPPDEILPWSTRSWNIPNAPTLPTITANGTTAPLSGIDIFSGQGITNRINEDAFGSPNFGSVYQNQMNAANAYRDAQATGNYITQFTDQGSPFLRNLGQTLYPIGAGISTAANTVGAIGSFNLYNNLINENPAFYDQQRGFANQARDIASQGNLFDVGLNFLQQGPEDAPTRFSSRVRQFDPYGGYNARRRLSDQGIGQLRSMFTGSQQDDPRLGLNLGDYISNNNIGLADAYDNARGLDFEISNFLDNEDYQNQFISYENRQRRNDFGNSLIQGARPGFQSFFTNEASRPLDMAGLYDAQRSADIAFRNNRLNQPLAYANAAGQGLANYGAGAIGLGTNWVPQQVPVGGAGSQGFDLAMVGNWMNNLAQRYGQVG